MYLRPFREKPVISFIGLGRGLSCRYLESFVERKPSLQGICFFSSERVLPRLLRGFLGGGPKIFYYLHPYGRGNDPFFDYKKTGRMGEVKPATNCEIFQGGCHQVRYIPPRGWKGCFYQQDLTAWKTTQTPPFRKVPKRCSGEKQCQNPHNMTRHNLAVPYNIYTVYRIPVNFLER